MIAIEAVPLLELAQLAISVEYTSCTVYDNTWYTRDTIYLEIDRRVRVGLVANFGGPRSYGHTP